MAVQTDIYGKPEVRYAGCVLDTYEHNGLWDSDCWDEEQQKIVEVEYDTTRCGGGGHAEIDATDDTLRAVYRYYKRIGRDLFDNRSNILQAKKARKGDTVQVIHGRKVPKGSVGVVFWTGYRYNYYSRMNEERIGIEIDGVRQFLPMEYVEVVGWESRLIRGKNRKQAIRNFAINSMPAHFRHLFIRAA